MLFRLKLANALDVLQARCLQAIGDSEEAQNVGEEARRIRTYFLFAHSHSLLSTDLQRILHVQQFVSQYCIIQISICRYRSN